MQQTNGFSERKVNRLIKIIEGEKFIRHTIRRWYTLGVPICCKIEYPLEGQINAIIKLGNSKSKKALKHLHRLLYDNGDVYEINRFSTTLNDDTPGEWIGYSIYRDRKNVLWCGGRLKEFLAFHMETDLWGNVENERGKEYCKIIEIIEESYNKLKSSLEEANAS